MSEWTAPKRGLPGINVYSSPFAKNLRQNQNWAEKRLWKELRGRKVAGFKFRRQHSIGPYILDFYCPEAHYAVEVDGDTHGTPERQQKDSERDAYFDKRGILTKRVWNSQLRENIEGILMAIRCDLETRRPSPLPASGGPPSPCGPLDTARDGQGRKAAA